MKVICPKCQFENQADSSRVVCARCATIVEVKLDQGTGFDSNGKRQTARLPFASNSPSNSSQQLGSQPFGQNKDVYATRIGDDFNDVLDVPDAPTNYSTTVEAVPMFEDVFTASSQDQAPVYDFASYEKTTPISSYGTSATRQRETQDYTEPPDQEFMGWPVLPENSIEEEEAAGNNRGGLFARVGLIVGVFGVLCLLAYYFLGGAIAKRKQGEANVAANAQGGNSNANSAAVQSSSPIAGAGLTANTGAGQAPVVTPKPSDSAAQQSPGAKDNSKPVNISPITNPNLVGRVGPSDPPKSASRPAQIPAAPNRGNLTVQVGSFKDQGEADVRAARLKSAGIEARVVKADIPGKGSWYRVQVGGFASREEAMNYGGQLRSKGMASDFIVTTISK